MPKKTIFLFLISTLLSVSCEQALQADQACAMDIEAAMENYRELMEDEDLNNDPELPPRECVIPEREPGSNLGLNVSLERFNAEQEIKMSDALARAKIVLNSAEFKERVLNHAYNGEKTFIDNNGQSNAEIYYSLMNAAEILFPEVDEEVDLEIELYYRNNKTVGYTYPNTTRIWVNFKFFSGYTLGQVAANAVHEWTHKLGYDHSKYNNSSRPYSVPYAVGSIIEDMVDGF